MGLAALAGCPKRQNFLKILFFAGTWHYETLVTGIDRQRSEHFWLAEGLIHLVVKAHKAHTAKKKKTDPKKNKRGSIYRHPTPEEPLDPHIA
jgi:hypothetical protein